MSNNFSQQKKAAPSFNDIMTAFGQVSAIMTEYDIGGNYEGACKALEVSGLTIDDIKRFRASGATYINNPLFSMVAKSQNVDTKKFLPMVDEFIKQYDSEHTGFNPSSGGNRETRRANEKIFKQYNPQIGVNQQTQVQNDTSTNGVSSWRTR